MNALLEIDGLNKRFAGLVAVNDVSFTLASGEIAGILGPNGAGKTTLFNLLTGFLPRDSGRVRFAGEDLAGHSPHQIVNRGLARTFQLCRPFAGMSVLENVMVGCLAPRARRHEAPLARARAILEAVGLAHRAPAPVEVLPYGDLRRLEIARALATKPRLLLLDEPFAGLGTSEIEPISALIRRLHAAEGLTILLIEHRLREFMQLVSRVIAMDFGRVIASGTPAEIVRHPRVIEAYLGRDEAADPAAEPDEAPHGAA
ncbi:MAG: ABC transporter ATP-binding protein [Acidibrevibacterium sp.]|uniref:ABC transporter ATP-binding protein n=1 Tax=Acidibrevibacterium sp. TaxID=2606776 RepID=UPI003D053FAB